MVSLFTIKRLYYFLSNAGNNIKRHFSKSKLLKFYNDLETLTLLLLPTIPPIRDLQRMAGTLAMFFSFHLL